MERVCCFRSPLLKGHIFIPTLLAETVFFSFCCHFFATEPWSRVWFICFFFYGRFVFRYSVTLQWSVFGPFFIWCSFVWFLLFVCDISSMRIIFNSHHQHVSQCKHVFLNDFPRIKAMSYEAVLPKNGSILIGGGIYCFASPFPTLKFYQSLSCCPTIRGFHLNLMDIFVWHGMT